MKKLKIIYKTLAVLLLIAACTDNDLRDLSFLETMSAPSKLELVYNITQDNTGSVTISPNAEGASTFDVFFGDATPDPVRIPQGENSIHVYAEGNYEVKIIAYNTKGDATEFTKPLVVSFRAPENVVVTLENDVAVSKQVNVNATADFATLYEFYSGETGVTQPVATANIGEALSYQYTTAGTYSVKVIAKGGAIETTESAVEFEVTEILAPIAGAPTPPVRSDADVISIFSDAYTDVSLDELPTGWSASGFEAITIETDNVWKLANLDFLGIVTNYANGIDVSAMESLHIDYWVPSGTDNELLVKIVNTLDGGEDIESLGTTVAGSWQSIDLDMTGFDGGNLANLNKITQIIIDSDGAAGVVYIDNFYFYKAPSGIVRSSVQDFEGVVPTITPFGSAAAEVIANPDASGVNTTANVVKFTKPTGAQTWAGATLDISSPLDLTNFSKLSVNTWSPTVGAVVKVKLENADASIVHEVDVNTTVANSWEDLVYDFSGAPAADYVKVVVFFDFGNAGDDSVYYYDEINLVNDSGVVAPLNFQDFEGATPTITPFGSAATEIIANPDASGVNTTANVVKFTKPAGAQTWAGATLDVSTPLDFATYSKISINTWSPTVGAVVKVKLENADASIVHEVDLNTTVANSWEDLVYDFSGAPAADYVKVVVFFDFGNAGDDSVYYYDELKLTN